MKFTTLAVSALAVASSLVLAAPAKRAGGSGQATYFYQGGNPGSCGWVSSDDSAVAAINSAQMDSSLCGQKIYIQANGKTIEATVADTCPTCDWGSVDLSVGAFQQLSSLDTGIFPITWWT